MLVLKRCPACGWQPDPDSIELECLTCGHSLMVLPQASPTGKRVVRFLIAVLEKAA
jgi:hypothetical protein